jgi:hypothetical protein
MSAVEGRARPKRTSKRTLRIWAALAGAAAFVLPWGVIRAIPTPSSTPAAVQVVTVPAGAQVVVQNGGKRPQVKVVGARGTPVSNPAVASTSGSHPVVR